MAALNQAELPKRHKTKVEQFNKSRQELSTAVDKLNQAIKDKAEKEAVLAAVEVVHTDYQKLTAVFE
jgi:predicted transcriptional regulator